MTGDIIRAYKWICREVNAERMRMMNPPSPEEPAWAKKSFIVSARKEERVRGHR